MKITRNLKATLAGYITAMFNALIVIEIDHLDYTLPSTYLKLFGAIVMPIIGGHISEIKKSTPNA